MSRPTKKTDILTAATANYEEMNGFFTNEELFTKGIYPWTGSSTLGSYFVFNTASHYNGR